MNLILLLATVFSVLGDSYSTFEGAIPPANGTWYRRNMRNNDVSDARATWWSRVAERTGMEIGVIDAWTSTTVCNRGYMRGANYEDQKARSFLARADRLGKPDVILVCGGTNDDWAGVPMGDYVYENWTDAQLYTFRPGLAKLFAELKKNYPRAKIYFILNSELKEETNDSVHTICAKMKIPCIDLHDIHKQDRHPSTKGMFDFAEQVIERLTADGTAKAKPLSANTAVVARPRQERDNYDWWARHDRILREGAAMNPEVVLVGDSITHHWAGLNSIGDAKDSATSPIFIEAFKGLRVLDLGFGWDRTQNMLWRLQNGELKGLKPGTVVLLAGTNNMTATPNANANSADEIAEGVIACVREIRRQLPAAKLIVYGILPRGADANGPMRTTAKQVNAQLAKVAGKERYQFVDIGDELTEADGALKAGCYRDGTHLTPAGYEVWKKSLARRLGR